MLVGGVLTPIGKAYAASYTISDQTSCENVATALGASSVTWDSDGFCTTSGTLTLSSSDTLTITNGIKLLGYFENFGTINIESSFKGGLKNAGTINLYGELLIESTSSNRGTINIFSGAILQTCCGGTTFTNENKGVINNSGSLQNIGGGTIKNYGKINNKAAGTIYNDFDASNTIINYGKINNQGSFENHGSFVLPCHSHFNGSGSYTGNQPLVEGCVKKQV
jgi:hypothetical protein